MLPNEPIISPGISPEQLDAPYPHAEKPPLNLWGLTLGMSLDLLSHMSLPPNTEPGRTILADAVYGNGDKSGFDFSIPATPYDAFPPLLAPSMTSIFPTFSCPDVNFFIWIFGSRYRHLVARWNDRLLHSKPLTPGSLPGAINRHGALQTSPHAGRVNFAGMALNQVRRAPEQCISANAFASSTRR